MQSYGMDGPFRLDADTINRLVSDVAPGVYVLGKLDNRGGPVVLYAGRSDTDLCERLNTWIERGYGSLFWFKYAASPQEAFGLECDLYHTYHPPFSKVHPDKPDGTNLKCPKCGK